MQSPSSSGAEAQFLAVYDQTTSYRTTDPSVTIGAIVRRPFDPEYTTTLVEHLIRRDPATFAELESIEFVEGDGSQTVATAMATPPPTPVATTGRPTPAAITGQPTKRPAESYRPTPFYDGVEETYEPMTNEPTKRPTRRPTNPPTKRPTIPLTPPPSPPPTGAGPVLLTIQGILWLDEDGNGLFETSEPPMEGLFVNLRECDGDLWRNTTTTNAIGQYQFVDVEEGMYYLDFFKPQPVERYEFTIPRVGGTDDRVLDSDVVRLADGNKNNGKSECMEVGEGFKQLTNAGYRLRETPGPTAPPSPPPSPPPTMSPTTGAPVPTAPPTPMFCAVVTGEDFDFQGCSQPCSSEDKGCPDGMDCAYTNDCS